MCDLVELLCSIWTVPFTSFYIFYLLVSLYKQLLNSSSVLMYYSVFLDNSHSSRKCKLFKQRVFVFYHLFILCTLCTKVTKECLWNQTVRLQIVTLLVSKCVALGKLFDLFGLI